MIATLPLRLFLAALSEHPNFSESVIYQFSGLLVVFVALGSIWALLEIIGSFFRRSADRQAAAPAVIASPGAAPVDGAPTLAPEIYIAIAAAVHCAYQGRVRVISVSPGSTDTAWAQEGRRAIFSSHHVRPR